MSSANVVVLALVIAAIGGGVAVGQTLYAVTEGASYAGGVKELRTIDRTTCATVSIIGTLSIAGDTINYVRGMAMDPTTGTMYGIYVSESALYIGTINLSTAVVTPVSTDTGFVEWLRDLTFDASGQLYAVSGNDGTNPNTLFTVNKSTGALAVKVALSGTREHGIAFNPATPTVLYHTYGTAATGDSGLETVNVATNAINPIGSTPDSAFREYGIVWDPMSQVFRVTNTADDWITIGLDGTRTDTGSECALSYFGLAFDQTTTVPVELAGFDAD